MAAKRKPATVRNPLPADLKAAKKRAKSKPMAIKTMTFEEVLKETQARAEELEEAERNMTPEERAERDKLIEEFVKQGGTVLTIPIK